MKNFKFKWLLLSIILSIASINTAWAGTGTVIGMAAPNTSDYYPKININTGGGDGCGWWDWYFEGNKAGITFEGKKLYIASWTDCWNGTDAMYLYEHSDKEGTQVNYNKVHDSYTAVGNYNTKIYNYNESGTSGSWYATKSTATGARFYFDATGWEETDIDLVVGHANWQNYYSLSNVDHTNLYYGNPGDAWSDAMGIGVVGNTSASSGENWLTNVSNKASEYTGWKNWDIDQTSAGNAYLCVNNGAEGEEPTMSYHPSHYANDALNYTLTMKYAVSTNGATPAELTSGYIPATITVSTYKFASGTYDAVSSSSLANTLTKNGSRYSSTATAARTAATTFEVSSIDDDYAFLGWYTAANEGTLLSSEETYTTYLPTASATIFARFSHENNHSVTVSYTCASTSATVSTATTPKIGEVTYSSQTAPTVAGYTFVNWTLGTGLSKHTSDAVTSNPIRVKTLSSGTYTLTANYTEDLTSTYYLVGNNTSVFPGPSTWTADNTNMLRKASGHSTDDEGSLTINVKSIPANSSDYLFKIHKSDGNKWYGWSNENYYWMDETKTTSLYDGEHDLYFIPNALGDYTFSVDWSDTDPSLTVTFPATTYTVNFGEGDGADGSASATYSSTSFSTGTKVQNGKSITLTAPDADDGYSWDGWYNASSGGSKVSSSNPLTTTISSSNHDFYARYTEATYTVAFNNGDHGTVSPSGDQQVGVSGVAITATPSGGYKFDHWSKTGDGVTLSSTTANPTTVTASGTGSVTANYAERYILRGSINDGKDTPGGLAGWSATSNSSYTSWSFVGNVLTIRANLTEAETTYKFQIVDLGTSPNTWHGQTGESTITASSKWTLDGTKDVYLQTTEAGEYIFVFDFSGGSDPDVSVAYPGTYISGDFTDWGQTEDNIRFNANGEASVELAAGDHEFKIIYGGGWYGKDDFTVTTTVLDQTLSTSGANCNITVPAGGGTYLFTWDALNTKLSVFTSADAAKAKLTKNKYVYCDARGNSGWKEADFDARFWFKNYGSGTDIGNVTCENALQNWVFYAQVPNSDFVGRVQMNRLNPSNHSDIWTTSSVIQAYTRSNANQNCMVVNTSDDGLTWGTYCPPMKTVTLEDNSTVTYGGNGSKATPYLVEKGGTIKLQAHTTKYVNDDNMTPKFLFFDAATKKVDQTDSAYNYTANASADVVHKMVVKTYNTYNSTNGDTIEITDTVYYKTVTCYNVTYSEPTNGNYTISVAGGSASSATKKAIAGQTITLAATPVNQAYTFKAWTVTKASSGTVTVTDNTFTMPSEAVTVTAEFDERFALLGSRNAVGDAAEGMPGWNKASAADFTVSSFTAVGSDDGVDLRCAVTLNPNRSYKFQIYDRERDALLGTSDASAQVTLDADESVEMSSVDTYASEEDNHNRDVLIYTAGYGTYTFKITKLSSTNYYPTVTVERQASYVLNMGCTDNGSVSAETTEGGQHFDITDGQYVASGGTITFAASPNVGYALDGWYHESTYENRWGTENPTSIGSISKEVDAYAKFVPVTLTFNATTDATWNTASNWSPACVPTIDHDVVLAKPVTVNVANAKAKSVLIDQSSSKTGKLTVDAGKALVVVTTIQKKNAGGSTVATEETDIVLESDGSNGTGALVAGSASTTTKATVHFYSKAKKDDSGNYINQYFGTPMDSVSKLNYYGSYLQKYDQPTDSWVSFTSEDKLGPWTAYRIMRSETTEGTYQIGGTLLLPGIGDGKTKTLTLNTSVGHDNDNMFANSWAAPISIAKFDASSDFTGATATIYIFNAGSAKDYASYGSSTASKDAHAGQWIAIPVSSVKSRPGDYDLHVIPSQQAFLVQASGTGAHSLALDYKKLVYDTIAGAGASIVPTCAPQRLQANDLEVVGLYMTGESGLGDRVLMYVRDDFSADEMDNGWEAYKLPGSAFAPQLCAYSGLGEMSISATNVVEGTVLGFYAGTEDSEYTFTFDYEGDKVWYLNDLEAQQSTLISAENSYSFVAVPGTVAERRFVISHTPIAHVPTGIDNSEAVDGMQVRKQMINGILYIIRGGQIYSTDGQMVK